MACSVEWFSCFYQYDFSSTRIASYAVYSQNADQDTKSPKSWILEGSDDNSTWLEIHSVENQLNWADWEKRVFHLRELKNSLFQTDLY